jgi:hypothetical protein
MNQIYLILSMISFGLKETFDEYQSVLLGERMTKAKRYKY